MVVTMSLTPEEKRKIEEEERFRDEVRSKIKNEKASWGTILGWTFFLLILGSVVLTFIFMSSL
tara:strand:- start:695 stop:883 length:189 start_codon:yes stop_codon:yes gene_type:complete